MPKYIIEREIPEVGNMDAAHLKAISKASCDALGKLGPKIQWVESFITGDKAYCLYISPNEEMVREHGRLGGFPVNRVSLVSTVIDPATAE